MMRIHHLFVWLLLIQRVAHGGSIETQPLEKQLLALTANFDGRVGICIRDAHGVVTVGEKQRFSLQSVMKLVVALAAMDAVDHRGWKLNDPVTFASKT